MPDQLTIMHAIAKRLADEGMDRALEHAENDEPNWGYIAVEYIKRYAQQHVEFAGWMVVKAASLDPNFPAPANEKAWGGVFKRAAHARYIENTKRTTKDPHRHGNPVPIWRSLVFIKK